jgi:hypothetical protein
VIVIAHGSIIAPGQAQAHARYVPDRVVNCGDSRSLAAKPPQPGAKHIRAEPKKSS